MYHSIIVPSITSFIIIIVLLSTGISVLLVSVSVLAQHVGHGHQRVAHPYQQCSWCDPSGGIFSQSASERRRLQALVDSGHLRRYPHGVVALPDVARE